MKESAWIWKNGELLAWEKATTHVLTHALHYGTAVFEGIRAYRTEKGPAIFRGREHFTRLIHSANIYQMPPPYTAEELEEAAKQLIKVNQHHSCYIRPLYYYGYRELGVNPEGNPVDAVIAAWEWTAYHGEKASEQGIRCKMSSWCRIESRILPTHAKCTANYANSVLAKREALDCGYDEAILLNMAGNVSEGTGENLFLVKEGKVFTPPDSDGPLPGITRETVRQIAKDLAIPCTSKSIARDELFLADELFFTGTAAEVTPIREVDGRMIGNGRRGAITETIQQRYFAIVHGQEEAYHKWLTFVD
ncbi:MAG: branched-chain amino acid transaminase [Waddliaceae bacterium]